MRGNVYVSQPSKVDEPFPEVAAWALASPLRMSYVLLFKSNGSQLLITTFDNYDLYKFIIIIIRSDIGHHQIITLHNHSKGEIYIVSG